MAKKVKSNEDKVKFTIPRISVELEDFFKEHKALEKTIKEKIMLCLGKYLFKSYSICNKEPLKGKLKGKNSLRVGYGYVVIYSIGGIRPNRYAKIVDINTESEYHTWMMHG